MAANFRVESIWQPISPGTAKFVSRFCLLSLACVAVATASGCGLLANAIYIVKGVDLPAEFDDLKEKKVAVIVSTEAGLNEDGTATLMTRHISELFARNIKKVEMVNTDEVDRIIHDQPIGDRSISIIGGRLKADYVVLVELTDLKLKDGQTLYRGRSNATVSAYKAGDGDRAVFKKSFPEFIYPQNGAPATDFDEIQFKRIYLSELSMRIARTFYPFDPSIDVAKDAAVSSLGSGL